MFKIQNLKFINGERYPILLRDNGIPDFWVTLFVTEKLRPTHTQSAITNIIYHLIHLKLWENINNRNLIDEFREKKFLSLEDVYSIRDHCMLDTRSLKNWIKGANRKIVKFPAVSTVNVAPIHSVSNNHSSNRISQIASFLDFIARTLLINNLTDEFVYQLINDMKKHLLANRPKGTRSSGLGGGLDSKAPHPDVFKRIMAIVCENSPENPFKGYEVRYRNAVIFNVLELTGMRAGEILALQIGDLDFSNRTIAIVRRHDAIEDPRYKQPVVKTEERRIPVGQKLLDRLKCYIMEIRANINGAKKHPYVFVTHKHGKYLGNPISNSTFTYRIVKPAIAVSPEYLTEITRHGFRHNFNYMISKRIAMVNKASKENPEISPINNKMEIQIRKHLNGWKSDKTAEIYNLRYIREEADRVMREDLDYWSKIAIKDNK